MPYMTISAFCPAQVRKREHGTGLISGTCNVAMITNDDRHLLIVTLTLQLIEQATTIDRIRAIVDRASRSSVAFSHN